MSALYRRLLALFCIPTVALAQTSGPLCSNYMTQDRQPDFGSGNFSQRSSVELAPGNRLRLDTDVRAIDPEAGIILPFEQRVTVDYVYQSGGGWWSLGYLFYDDLIARGYIDDRGTPSSADDILKDDNGNGMKDFHEDLYNMGPLREYIGVSPRCTQTFTHNGRTFRVPELALRSCFNNTYVAPGDGPSMFDARPGATGTHKPALIGEFIPSNVTGLEFSDRGLYGRVPNLLEPMDDLNEREGLGHLIFLTSDDDNNTNTTRSLSPVNDISTTEDGIPDYDTSAYDGNGRLLATNPDPGMSARDRRVDLGVLPANREIVFFLITGLPELDHNKPSRFGGQAEVYPCAVMDSAGQCQLHMKAPISVFFSKSTLNMDQNPLTQSPAARRDIGCAYPSVCNNTGSNVQGWLDAATIARLNTAAYGNLDLGAQHEVQMLPRPAHDRMPHVFVGAPSSDPYRWILGFEDLNGGGDRDFNDVVFLVNRQNVGVVQSGVVTGDISPSVAPDYTITTIKFTRDDDATTCTGATPCYHEDRPGACAGAAPSIDYDVAVDCRICNGTTCTDNPNPTWTRVVFPDTTPPTRTAELNMLDLGFTGSQLCWRAQIRSSNQYCRPTINNIDVNYQALKAGRYSRSAVTPVGNAILFGSREVPGSRMTPAASTRLYDNRKDFSLRGHLSLQSLYDPENPTATNPVVRWDAGKVMSDRLFGNIDEPRNRNLYTVRNELLGDYTRIEVEEDLAESNGFSRGFPSSLCSVLSGGRYVYDLNRDGVCDGKDRAFLKDWLYGYEDGQDPAPNNVRRAWAMGGIDQSTPAFVGPAGRPGWWYRVPFTEQQAYDQRYLQSLGTRESTAFVGTVTGFLHAFNAGQFRTGDDTCTPASEVRGYFRRTDASCGGGPAREYGSGRERYAYLPGTLLPRYINHYVAYRPGDVVDGAAAVNASPTVADVDLGGAGGAWTVDGQPGRGAKTVLVSTTGKNENTVFALDVTQANDPKPLWEYTLNQGLNTLFTAARILDSNVRLPDTKGSRHSPAVVRMRFAGANPELRWVAVVATDYQTNTNAAGTVYFLDMATGRPVGTLLEPALGVVTLESNEGIGGEPSVVDVDQDGVFDVVYVPSTTGRVWRINPGIVNGPRIGQRLATCKVADVPADLSARTDAALQRLHSPVAARVVSSTRHVRLFLGTGDDPDRNDTAADNYHLMAYVDTSPLAATCTGASTLWKKTLPAGERVWGGMVANETDVYTTTAVGPTVQPCDLSSTQFGAFYGMKQEPDSAGLAVDLGGSGTSLGGHGISVPVLHDNHLFIASVEGQPLMVGNDQWNNRDGGGGGRGTRVLMFEVSPEGKLPR